MLFFTGFSRIASSVAKSQIENIPQKKAELGRMRMKWFMKLPSESLEW